MKTLLLVAVLLLFSQHTTAPCHPEWPKGTHYFKGGSAVILGRASMKTGDEVSLWFSSCLNGISQIRACKNPYWCTTITVYTTPAAVALEDSFRTLTYKTVHPKDYYFMMRYRGSTLVSAGFGNSSNKMIVLISVQEAKL